MRKLTIAANSRPFPYCLDINKTNHEYNSRFSHDVTKIQTKKLSILLSFMRYYTAHKHLYLNKVLVPKGSSFCDRGRLNL